MSYSIGIGTEDIQPLASVAGWRELSEWCDTLDAATYPKLIGLTEWAVCEGLDDLKAEIEAALRDDPPDADIAATLSDLVDILHEDHESDVCFVTDGQTKSEDVGEWDSGPDAGDPADAEAVKKKSAQESVSRLMQ